MRLIENVPRRALRTTVQKNDKLIKNVEITCYFKRVLDIFLWRVTER
jgi:hypothetical protein